jgi:hypothetical protein
LRKKRLYILFTVLVLIVFCIISLLSAGCHLIGYKSTAEEAREELERKETEWATAEQAGEEADKQVEIEEEPAAEEKAEESSEAEEEIKSFPDKPVTYTGNISGLPVTLIVDFKTKEITGSLDNPAIEFPNFEVIDGTIYLDNLEITVNFLGVTEMDSDGNVIQTSWLAINGKMSNDLSTINGKVLTEEGEKGEITLTK